MKTIFTLVVDCFFLARWKSSHHLKNADNELPTYFKKLSRSRIHINYSTKTLSMYDSHISYILLFSWINYSEAKLTSLKVCMLIFVLLLL